MTLKPSRNFHPLRISASPLLFFDHEEWSIVGFEKSKDKKSFCNDGVMQIEEQMLATKRECGQS